MSKLQLPYLILLNSLFLASCLLLWPGYPYLLAGLLLLLLALILRWHRRQLNRQRLLQRSLEAGFLSLQDGDFAISLPNSDDPQAQTSIQLFNRVADKLRRERQHIHQRELLLDKLINASSTLTVLVNGRDEVVFTNHAARHIFLADPQQSTANWSALLAQRIPELNEQALDSSSLFVTMLDPDQQPQAWHLTCSQLKLHGASHRLYLFQPMSDELNQRELQTWRKVVRVINHELNNSLAPISSMCHSGRMLAEKLDEPRLDRVFATISRRVNHLAGFIRNYSQLARISQPNFSSVDLLSLLQDLRTITPFRLEQLSEQTRVSADPQQLEQVFINLLKNAQEAAPEGEISVTLDSSGQLARISILDQGPGIAAELLPQVLLPGFSSKANGSGIGLALCREVVEAHGGRLCLYNHPPQGLEVVVLLPVA